MYTKTESRAISSLCSSCIALESNIHESIVLYHSPRIAIKSKMIVPLGDDITFMVRSMRYQEHPLRQYPL